MDQWSRFQIWGVRTRSKKHSSYWGAVDTEIVTCSSARSCVKQCSPVLRATVVAVSP